MSSRSVGGCLTGLVARQTQGGTETHLQNNRHHHHHSRRWRSSEPSVGPAELSQSPPSCPEPHPFPTSSAPSRAPPDAKLSMAANGTRCRSSIGRTPQSRWHTPWRCRSPSTSYATEEDRKK